MNKFHEEKSKFRQRILQQLSMALGILMLCGCIILYAFPPFNSPTIFITLTCGIGFIILGFFTKSRIHFTPFVAHGFLLIFALASTAAALVGRGFAAEILAALLLLPGFSTFLLGMGAGMVYTFLTLVLYVGIFLVDSYQIVHYAGFSIDDLNKSKIIVYCATILASLAMALAFDHSRRIMEKGLIALNDSLEHEKLRAERSLAIKTSFLANMSHEIRTPMNGILGMTSLLRGSTSDPTLVEKIEVIETSGKLLLGIIDDILDFSKLEAGRMSIERIPVQLSQLVRETTSLVRSKAHDNRITIVERISDDLPAFIYCDPVRVKQVLINLLANAIKFSADSSVDVEVVTQSHEGDRLWVQLSVKDRGIGIDRDSQDELFKAFSQADLSTTRKYGGTGLGLALCKRFVELMGGRIWVESEVGCGSTFFFNFPTERVAADIHELTADSLPAVAPVVFPIHILVADDNQINRVVADGILKRIGYQADFAFTGAQALQAASRKTYDIIFMDCHMPEMDGFEATLQIRELPSRHRPFIIALSASVMQEERERCILSGMDKFLAKPLQEKELKAVIKEYAAAHDLQPIAYKIAT